MEQLTPLFRSKRVPLGLLAALLVAFLLSLPYLASEQLWYDEVLSRSIYTHSPSLPAMTTYLAQNENHPPFYYYLMFGWTRIFGASPLAIRFPSVIFTVATVGLLYGLCREWFNRRTAVLAALLYALSPMAVEYSREARPYTLIAALSVASWWILVRWLKERPGRMLLPAFCLLTLAGLYTHYAYLFLFLVQCFAVFLSFSSRRTTAPADGRRRAWLWAILAIVAGFLPWLPVVIENFFRQYIYPEGLEPLSRLVMPSDFIFLDLFFNFLFFPSKWPVDALGRTIQAAVAALFAVGGVLAVRSAWRRWPESADGNADHCSALAAFAAGPIFIFADGRSVFVVLPSSFVGRVAGVLRHTRHFFAGLAARAATGFFQSVRADDRRTRAGVHQFSAVLY